MRTGKGGSRGAAARGGLVVEDGVARVVVGGGSAGAADAVFAGGLPPAAKQRRRPWVAMTTAVKMEKDRSDGCFCFHLDQNHHHCQRLPMVTSGWVLSGKAPQSWERCLGLPGSARAGTVPRTEGPWIHTYGVEQTEKGCH